MKEKRTRKSPPLNQTPLLLLPFSLYFSSISMDSTLNKPSSLTILKSKIKFPEKAKRVLSGKFRNLVPGFEIEEKEKQRSDEDLMFELDEDLTTFQFTGFKSGTEINEEKVEVDSNLMMGHPRFGKEILKQVSGSENIPVDDKRSDLEFELSQRVISLERVRRIASSGLPNGGGLRATTWKLLLGYLSTSRDLWERELADNRLKYARLKEELLLNPSEISRKNDEALDPREEDKENHADLPLRRQEVSPVDHPLSLGKTSIWHQYFQYTEIVEQIDRDLQRTHPDIKFFSGDSSFSRKHRQAMRSILLLFAKLNPAIGYVQGMNEVLAPLYFVFSTDPDEQNASNAEADSFACFVRVLSDSVDHFCEQLDNSSSGILSTLSRLTELLKHNDEQLWRHLLVSNKVNPQFYAFRWITLLLTQEFNFTSIMRIWDSLLGNPDGVQEMLLRVCCAMLLCVRSRLLGGDFIANLKLLQHYPEINLEHLLEVAHEISPITSPSSLSPL